ncbi:MAG: DKNYY domain-containing protein [Tannerella sp.]|nr:DKNYY domain-containing protein [Tannerella sp.]
MDGGRCYARDKYHIFYADSYEERAFILDGADLETFEIVNQRRNFAKDKNHYYFNGEIISYEDAVKKELFKNYD